MSKPELDQVLSDIATEFETTKRVDTQKWLLACPDLADVLVDFVAELQLQGGLDPDRPPDSPWEDPGRVVDHVLERHRDDFPYVEARLGRELLSARRRAASDKSRAPLPFKRAAVYAWAFDILRDDGYEATRYSTGKTVYLLEKALRLGLFEDHKQMAYGPYDPKLRYGSTERIGGERSWFHVMPDGHIRVGDSVSEVHKYATRYVREVSVARRFVEYLRTFDFSGFESAATVLWAAEAISEEGSTVDTEAVLRWLDLNWPAKLARRQFSAADVRSTLNRLSRLQLLPVAGGGR